MHIDMRTTGRTDDGTIYIHIYMYIREEDRTVWRTAPFPAVRYTAGGEFLDPERSISRTASGCLFGVSSGRRASRSCRWADWTGPDYICLMYLPIWVGYLGSYLGTYIPKQIGGSLGKKYCASRGGNLMLNPD